MNCYKTEQVDAAAVREKIRLASLRLKLTETGPEEREEMRLYFEERYDLKPCNVFSKRIATDLQDIF